MYCSLSWSKINSITEEQLYRNLCIGLCLILKLTPLQKSRYLRNLCVGLCLGLILTPLQKSSYIRTCLLLPFLFLQSCTGTSAYLPRLLLCCSWYHANPVHLSPDTVAPLDLWLLEKMKIFLHKVVKNIRNSSKKVCVRLEPHFFYPRPATPPFQLQKKLRKTINTRSSDFLRSPIHRETRDMWKLH